MATSNPDNESMENKQQQQPPKKKSGKRAADEIDDDELADLQRMAEKMERMEAYRNDGENEPDDLNSLFALPGETRDTMVRPVSTHRGATPQQRSRYHYMETLVKACRALDELGLQTVVLYNEKNAVPNGAMHYLPRLRPRSRKTQLSSFRFNKMPKSLQDKVVSAVNGLAKHFNDEKIV